MTDVNNIYDIIIIGGGPGGIGCSVEASYHKVGKILLIEKSENHSHTIRKYYKDNKRVDKDWKGKVIELEGNVEFFDGTKESTLNYFDMLLDTGKIDSLFETEVDRIEKESNLLHIHTPKGTFKGKNCVITIGKMGKPNKPNYKIPPSLASNINFNLQKCTQGEKILVVGGGDSAAEYAYELAQRNNVTLAYRKENFSRLNPKNEEILRQYDGEEKLRLRLGTDILSLENEDGRIKVNFDNGYHTIYDRIIYAIGGSSPIDFLQKSNIQTDEKGTPVFDSHYESNIEGLYVAGDIAYNSGGSIAMALNHGYHIVNNILKKRGEIYSATQRVLD
jgi:thioredoxin reductase (NADPH)